MKTTYYVSFHNGFFKPVIARVKNGVLQQYDETGQIEPAVDRVSIEHDKTIGLLLAIANPNTIQDMESLDTFAEGSACCFCGGKTDLRPIYDQEACLFCRADRDL